MLSLKAVCGTEGGKHVCSSLGLGKDCNGKRQGGGTNKNGSHWMGDWLLGAPVYVEEEEEGRRRGLLPRRPGDSRGEGPGGRWRHEPKARGQVLTAETILGLLVLKQAWLRRILDILSRTLLGFDVKPCLDVKTHPYTLLSFP